MRTKQTVKRLVIQHKPTGRKAVVLRSNKVTLLGSVINHILNKNHWGLQDVKLKHLTCPEAN